MREVSIPTAIKHTILQWLSSPDWNTKVAVEHPGISTIEMGVVLRNTGWRAALAVITYRFAGQIQWPCRPNLAPGAKAWHLCFKGLYGSYQKAQRLLQYKKKTNNDEEKHQHGRKKPLKATARFSRWTVCKDKERKTDTKSVWRFRTADLGLWPPRRLRACLWKFRL